MSNATASSSSSSASGSQPSGVLSPVPTVAGEGQYGENIMYQHGLQPNPYQLLYLFNSGQYDDQIRAAADQHNRLEPCIKSLFFLQSQRNLFKKIIESCSLEIANQVILWKLLFHPEVKVVPTVGGKAPSEEYEVEDKDRENQTPPNDDNPLTMSLRSPTLLPTPMTLLIDHVSALCVDWNAISPEIAHKENAEESIHNSSGDADFLFIGADPRKVGRFEGLLLVDERVATGWQPTQDVPATPMLRDVDDMPDTSYNYDTELYRDGES
uniref:Uncharacterized protein n=1 Tax=Moniliophthora roreri TaxID=221103 RepID=A0A0W0F6W6_MONRR